ncbi:unnamed protein product [Enterobius vermicularis]|uniref:Uncharacterized protein n=1 Tax=Enterobius vermicularis TaxID=51028 RepID=A0A0N4V1M6_ENTVE|nr:unnamed protein product [Enterobius vermicularis]
MDVYSSFIGAGRDVHFVLFYLRHGGKRKKEKEERNLSCNKRIGCLSNTRKQTGKIYAAACSELPFYLALIFDDGLISNGIRTKYRVNSLVTLSNVWFHTRKECQLLRLSTFDMVAK